MTETVGEVAINRPPNEESFTVAFLRGILSPPPNWEIE